MCNYLTGVGETKCIVVKFFFHKASSPPCRFLQNLFAICIVRMFENCCCTRLHFHVHIVMLNEEIQGFMRLATLLTETLAVVFV